MPNIFPNSPADGTYLKDDFLTNSAVADATVGELDWEITAITGANTLSLVASQNGVLRSTTDGTTAHGSAIHLNPDGIVLAGTNQYLRCLVRYPDISGNVLTGNNFRLGFSASVTATEPAVGVWIDSDAGVLSFDVASTNGDSTQAVADVSTLTDGTTMVKGTWHDIELKMSGENANGGPSTVDCFVDGEHAGRIERALLGSAETMELSFVHWDDGAGATLEWDIDYIEAWLPRN